MNPLTKIFEPNEEDQILSLHFLRFLVKLETLEDRYVDLVKSNPKTTFN